jgi:rod shape-determining protein MreD
MKPRVYFIILLLIIPVQASLFSPLALAGIKPDLALAVIYVIGLLTGPGEAVLAGIGIGLVQDIGSASLIGLNGFTRGLIGLFAGLLGRRVLDISSPSNLIFLAAFSLVEGLFIALFMQVFYGSVPVFRLFFTSMLPQALYTGVLGILLLRFISSRNVLNMLKRHTLQKEL